ncbi:SLAM family member 5 isoform X2 [Cavia porcellus]|uniref:CD84 molecule n=1 Tax=Cavia porcellus TaxID=10141 RepID=A0A286Y362_CAVPO|nr:SLAM family member 5 isoform X2 [Cavia porcellus]
MARCQPWILFLCLQTCLVAAGRDTDPLIVNGTLGESATFPLNIQNSQQVKTIAWTSESSVAFITLEDSGKTTKVFVTHNKYKGRIKVINESYNLVISDLNMKDTGKYKADITTTDTNTITRSYYLHVYRRLGNPKITQSIMTSVNGTCNVTLICSVDKDEKNVTYRWSSATKEGNVLQIIQTPENEGLNYTCTAQNPVSNNSSSISSQQLCADTAKDFNTRPRTELGIGLLVTCLLVVLILLLAIGFYFHRRKLDVSSENTVYTHVKGSRDTKPVESRIYDEISHARESSLKKEPVQTIYSTVQSSDEIPLFCTFVSKIISHSLY